MSYHCPACNKVSRATMDLARHMIGWGDKVHRDWINARGFKYSEMLASQSQYFCDESYKELADLLERGAKAED